MKQLHAHCLSARAHCLSARAYCLSARAHCLSVCSLRNGATVVGCEEKTGCLGMGAIIHTSSLSDGCRPGAFQPQMPHACGGPIQFGTIPGYVQIHFEPLSFALNWQALALLHWAMHQMIVAKRPIDIFHDRTDGHMSLTIFYEKCSLCIGNPAAARATMWRKFDLHGTQTGLLLGVKNVKAHHELLQNIIKLTHD